MVDSNRVEIKRENDEDGGEGKVKKGGGNSKIKK